MSRLDAIRKRAAAAEELAGYGGRPEAAEIQLQQIEHLYSTDVPWLLKEYDKLATEFDNVMSTLNVDYEDMFPDES